MDNMICLYIFYLKLKSKLICKKMKKLKPKLLVKIIKLDKKSPLSKTDKIEQN